eukprot:m.356201 g.356201  ORF g.356201 m.356201 type:complete len:298 (+) comp17470_c0_seq1:226-1119(+)
MCVSNLIAQPTASSFAFCSLLEISIDSYEALTSSCCADTHPPDTTALQAFCFLKVAVAQTIIGQELWDRRLVHTHAHSLLCLNSVDFELRYMHHHRSRRDTSMSATVAPRKVPVITMTMRPRFAPSFSKTSCVRCKVSADNARIKQEFHRQAVAFQETSCAIITPDCVLESGDDYAIPQARHNRHASTSSPPARTSQTQSRSSRVPSGSKPQLQLAREPVAPAMAFFNAFQAQQRAQAVQVASVAAHPPPEVIPGLSSTTAKRRPSTPTSAASSGSESLLPMVQRDGFPQAKRTPNQ